MFDADKCMESMLRTQTHLVRMVAKMGHGDRKQVISDDGNIYEIEALRLSNAETLNVLVISEEMQAVAIALLPIVQSMAKSRAKRAIFLKTSERRIDAYDEQTLLQAEKASLEADEYVQTLALVAKGVSMKESQRVTLRTWQKIMTTFHQTNNFSFKLHEAKKDFPSTAT